MPRFDGMAALEVLQASGIPIPFIIVSGSIGEVRAVEALKAGAANYVMKGNLEKLPPVVERELRDAKVLRERNAAFQALEQAVKARDEFLSISSHELKTPLTALHLRVEALRRAAGMPGAVISNEHLITQTDSIARSSTRLSELIDRLLDITRVSTGPFALVLEEADLSALVRGVAERMGPVLRDSGSALQVHGPASLLGRWDRQRIEMLLWNVLTNAAKFGEGKPIDVDIEDAADHAVLRVVDRGIGISAADQRRIFERFERAVPEKHYGGFGMGLWLSRKIAEAHGGTIDVLSTTGGGSTFAVSLPKGPPQT
jgi:signal transduction histidine kinase